MARDVVRPLWVRDSRGVDVVAPGEGVELSYAVAGEGEPLVLVSGLAADSSFWAPMAPSLTPHCRVVTFDPRGSGRSSSPDRSYSLDALGQDVLAVLTAAGMSTAHVVGHSMGAGVALWLARHHPDRVSSVILFNAAERLGVHGRLALTAAGYHYECGPNPLRQLSEALFPWLYSRQFLEHGDNLALLLRASLDYPFPQSQTGYVRQLEALMGMDARPWLEQIDTTCLVVAAEHDALLPPEESARLAAAIPGTDYVVVAGSGHCTPVERPMLCSSLVLGHLARAGARASTQAEDRFSP